MQKKLLFQWQYIIISAFLTILCLLGIWVIHTPFFGIPAFLVYLLFFGHLVGQNILPDETTTWKLFFGTLTLGSLVVTLLSGIYFFSKIHAAIFSAVLLLVPIACSLINGTLSCRVTFPQINPPRSPKALLTPLVPPLLILLGDAAMLYKLWSIRSTDPPISPWSFLGPTFFVVFCITTILLLFYTSQKTNKYRFWLIIPHTLLLFSVTLIVYAYGFGFDPFIHQAAEQWILDHGVITPKQPYYLGQYMMSIALYYLSHLDIQYIDQSLVPIGSALLLPTVSYFVYSRLGFIKKLLPAIVLLAFIPLPFFTLTTPNNLALLFALLTILMLWYQTTHTSPRLYLISGALLALTTAIHAFIGIPLFVIFVAFFIYQKTVAPNKLSPISPLHKRWGRGGSTWLAGIYIFLLASCLPLIFWLNGLRTKQHIGLQNPLAHLTNLKEFFAIPHWYWVTPAPLSWDILYRYKLALPIIIGLIMAVGMWTLIKRYRHQFTAFWIVTGLGLFLLAAIMITGLRFPGVISYEQSVYARRIIELALISLLPFFIIATRELLLWVQTKRYAHIPLTILLGVLVTISWYFTYPTRDPVSRYTGYSVRAADIEAVRSIHEKNNREFNYIVLTNQTVATAALREFGFATYWPTTLGEQYFYSIPTGGPFYQYFRKMVYEYPKKEWMLQAMDVAGVDRAYFIHTNYWYPAGELRDAAKLETDDWWAIGENPEKVWVFEYVR